MLSYTYIHTFYYLDLYSQDFMHPQLARVLFLVVCMLDIKLVHKHSQVTYNLIILILGQIYFYRSQYYVGVKSKIPLSLTKNIAC